MISGTLTLETSASGPADLDVSQAAAALADGILSSSELVEATLSRIDERDGVHSHDGDETSINAWIRVYAEDARRAARGADDRRSRAQVEDLGPAPVLCGVPIGLQDLFAVAGKPLTASSRILNEVPLEDSVAWARLRNAGMVLVGHLHTHEFGAGVTTDQVANPWDRTRSAGGAAGGPAAAVAATMIAAAIGADTFGSLRIPAALSGASAFKPTRGAIPMGGVVPLCPTLDHVGPMAQTVADCALLYQAMSGRAEPKALRELPLAGTRIGRSPRAALTDLEPDVVDAYESAVDLCAALGAEVLTVRPPAPVDVLDDYFSVFGQDVLAYHQRFEPFRELYRASVKGLLEQSEREPIRGKDLAAAQARRQETIDAWMEWFATRDVLAVIEPTVGSVAPTRGGGYAMFGTQLRLGWFCHYWNWTGFPVVTVPAGPGQRSSLPVGISLIGPKGTDIDLLRAAMTLQHGLGDHRVPANADLATSR